MSRTLLISPFAKDETSGHPVVDDLFFIGVLSEQEKPYFYATSEFVVSKTRKDNCKNITFINNASLNPNSLISALKFAYRLNHLDYERIIFCGFTEKLLFAFWLVNSFNSRKFILIATNNFGKRRVNKYRLLMKLTFSICKYKISKIIAHSKYEKKVIQDLVKTTVAIKKHHLCIRNKLVDSIERRYASPVKIGFMGPNKLEKPLDDFISLIRADSKAEFQFEIVNCSIDDIPPDIREKDNVKIINRWFSGDEYSEFYASFSYAFLSHSEEFEGKLSGNLCDCLSLSVPWISKEIEPYREISSQFEQETCLFYSSNKVEELIKNLRNTSPVKLRENLRSGGGKLYELKDIKRDLDFMI